MTNSFKTNILIVAVVGLLVGGMCAGEEKKNTTASVESTAVATMANIAGVAVGMCGIVYFADPKAKLPLSLSNLTQEEAYMYLIIPGVALTGASLFYLLKSAKGEFNKICSVAGSIATGLGSVVLTYGSIGLTGHLPSDRYLAAALIPALIGFGAAGIGYYLQPKNTETEQV